MTTENLEREQPQAELEKPPVEKESVKPTEPKEEPTVRMEETPEFKRALGKSTESLTRQASLAKQAEATAKAEAEQHKLDIEAKNAELGDIQGLFDDLANRQFEDPDEKRSYLASIQNKRVIAEERRQIAKEKAEAKRMLEDAGVKEYEVIMNRTIDEEIQRTSIDRTELMDCATPEEVRLKARDFELAKLKEGNKEPEKTPHFDSLTGLGAGVDLSKMSADEKITYALEHPRKIK